MIVGAVVTVVVVVDVVAGSGRASFFAQSAKFTFNIFASLTIEKFNSKCFKAAVPNLGYVRFSSI